MRVSRAAAWLVPVLFLTPALVPSILGQTAPPTSFTLAAEQSPMPKGSVEHDPTTGSFARSIPIEVPAFHGIEPRLGLSYSSQGGNGFAGVGWQLGGWSVVERTRNGRGIPRFIASDVFVLNGQELLPCATATQSPGCAAGGTHATKQESYNRIVFDNGANTWTIWAKSGVRTVLAPVYQVAGGTWRWGQSQVIDTHGNTVTYQWECADGDCYPRSVTYGPYTVRVFRETTERPDVMSFGTGGLSGLGYTRYRLRSVLVARDSGSPIRAYGLTYETSPATGRSLLTGVQQYGYDVQIDAQGVISGGTSLPPQIFTYQQYAE